MNALAPGNLYRRHHFPSEIVSHGVWLYCRLCLSHRDVEEQMAAHAVTLTSEVVRDWFRKFGQPYPNQLRRRHPRPGDIWHLDRVLRTINGER